MLSRPFQISNPITVTQNARKGPHSGLGVVRHHYGQQWLTAAMWKACTQKRHLGMHLQRMQGRCTHLLVGVTVCESSRCVLWLSCVWSTFGHMVLSVYLFSHPMCRHSGNRRDRLPESPQVRFPGKRLKWERQRVGKLVSSMSGFLPEEHRKQVKV